MIETGSENRLRNAYYQEKNRFYNRFLNCVTLVPDVPLPSFLSERLFRASPTIPCFFVASFSLGLSPKLVTSDGYSLLNFCCRFYNLPDLYDVIETLFDHGVEPEHSNRQGNNAVHCLCLNERLPVIKRLPDIIHLLHRHNADVNHVDNNGENALWILSRTVTISAFYSVSKALIDCGVNVRYRSRNQRSNPLLEFLKKLNFLPAGMLHDLIRYFVFHGLNADDSTLEGWNLLTLTAVLCCEECGNQEFFDVVNLLLNLGLHINHLDNANRNVLNALSNQLVDAASFYKAASFLVKRGVDCRNVDNFNENPLISFLYKIGEVNDDVLDVVYLFARRGLDLNHKYSGDFNVLWVAIDRNDLNLYQVLELMRHLIELGASVSPGCLLGLLMKRLESVRAFDRDAWFEIVKLLLENGDDPNAFDAQRKITPLLKLCSDYKWSNLIEIIELMFRYGLDVNYTLQMDDGDLNPVTRLQANASQTNNFNQLLKLLVECGFTGVDFASKFNRKSLLRGIGSGNIIKRLSRRCFGL